MSQTQPTTHLADDERIAELLPAPGAAIRVSPAGAIIRHRRTDRLLSAWDRCHEAAATLCAGEYMIAIHSDPRRPQYRVAALLERAGDGWRPGVESEGHPVGHDDDALLDLAQRLDVLVAERDAERLDVGASS